MEKKSIVNQVQKKLKEDKDKVAKLAQTFRGITEASIAVQSLRDFQSEEKLSRIRFSKVLETLISVYKIHTVSEDHKKELKVLKVELMPESKGIIF